MNLLFNISAPNLNVIETIFNEDATVTDLLLLVSALAVFWFFVFYFAAATIRPLVYNKPWLIAAGERDYERGGKELYEKMGIPKTKPQFVEMFMDMWAWNQTMAIQHFLGGLVCLPAVVPGNFGLAPSVASSLACLGILSEMGWEWEDMLTWIYKRFATPHGKLRVPMGLLAVLAIHHSLTSILGIPVVLHYRDLNVLHWLCFDLQAAAAVTLVVIEYTKMLDITKPSELRQFQSLTLFALIVIIFTRGFHWVYLCCKFIYIWYQEKNWGLFVIGTLVTLVFSLFNWAFCIEPFYKRFRKFMKVSAEFEALPSTATATDRRKSVMNLEAAAADVLSRQNLEEELVASLFPKRKTERRSTMPASMFAGKKGGGSKRSSMVMLRSSMGEMSPLLTQLGTIDDDEW